MSKVKCFLLFSLVLSISYSCENSQNTDNSVDRLTDKYIEDTILSLKEVQDKNHFIDSISGHKKGIAFIIDKPDDLEPAYHIQVGYNANETFETYFHFYMDTISKEITIDDFAQGKRISLEEWRNQNSDSMYTELGMELLKSERLGNLRIDMKAHSVVFLYRYPEEISKQLKWETDGLFHVNWVYKKKGIELDVCWENENEQRISSITIMEPSALKTTRDIGIGSSREQVLTAYKPEIDPRAENQKLIVAGSVYGGMIFEIENNKVKSIFIGAAAE